MNIRGFFKKNYGLLVLAGYVLVLIIVIYLWGENLYIPWNDNLDSNIPINKMYRDNSFFFDRTSDVPFLGGVSRDILTNGYTFVNIMYFVFDTPVAYSIVYVLHVIISCLGFYFLAQVLSKYDRVKVNPNLFSICGIVYSMLGTWPSAYIGFALLPWWIWGFYLLYKARKKWVVPVLFLLAYNTSLVLIGIFLLFYAVAFFILKSIREKKFDALVFIALTSLIIVYGGANFRHIAMAMVGSAETTKSTVQSVMYNDSLFDCAMKFWDVLSFNESVYHCGIFPLKYFAVPVVLAFGAMINVERKKLGIERRIVFIYDTLLGVLMINALAFGFDNCYLRRYIPFASGFAFSRFVWLSPFVIMICLTMALQYLDNNGRKVIEYGIVLAVIGGIVVNPDYYSKADMYNALYVNFRIAVTGSIPNEDIQWKWNDFYSTSLFYKIKEDIKYNREWAIAYGLDPAILQYNGISTLDGYYSNYSREYYQKWQSLMMPEFERDLEDWEYWNNSGGIRAYVESPLWDIPVYSLEGINQAELYIDMGVFQEMNGKFIFSRIAISNAEELELDLLGRWDGEESGYTIYVYEVR